MTISVRGLCLIALVGLLMSVAVSSSVAQPPGTTTGSTTTTIPSTPATQTTTITSPNAQATRTISVSPTSRSATFTFTPLGLNAQSSTLQQLLTARNTALQQRATTLATNLGTQQRVLASSPGLITAGQTGLVTSALLNRAQGVNLSLNANSPLPNLLAARNSLIANASLASSANPYLGSGAGSIYNPYGGGYCDPYAGYLRGIADITNANAQYYAIIQQARVTEQKANQSALETRQKWFDQIRYERSVMPTPEDIRIAELTTALNRSRRNPPLVEIWAGDSLNSLLDALIKIQNQGFKGPRVDLDEDLLKHINVTTGTGGNIGLLKDGGKLQWPPSLQRPDYDAPEKALAQLLPEAIQQVRFNGELGANLRNDIQANLNLLEEAFNKDIPELSPSQYIESRRYLNQLRESFKALQEPKAANYFNKWTARGKTVAELVKNMADAGLRFAPAAPGDEAYYKALHTALVAYDDALAQVARGSSSTGP